MRNIEEERDGEIFSRKFSTYRELIQEYCFLAAKCALTSTEADRMDTILEKASFDSFLGLLVDEADHIVAHELGLIHSEAINYQQQKLLTSISQKIAKKTEEISNTNQENLVLATETSFYDSNSPTNQWIPTKLLLLGKGNFGEMGIC